MMLIAELCFPDRVVLALGGFGPQRIVNIPQNVREIVDRIAGSDFFRFVDW
jgi:hypothetical protein